jgi:hypothetical protein
LGQPSAIFNVTSISLGAQGNFTRGTGPQTIVSKTVVKDPPVQSAEVLQFEQAAGLSYEARLYELRDKVTGAVSSIVPNWFGVAVPNPNSFDISADVHVLVYFHPIPGQQGAGYRDADYLAKIGSGGGTDWKQLYAYVDRLGGQAAGAIRAGARANRVVIFPFLTSAQYTLPIGEWFNVIHEILKDINSNLVNGICTRPKKIIVGTLSNGSFYLNRFLDQAATHPNNSNIIEAWDFDTAISTPQVVVNPHGKRLRAYWQGQVPASTPARTYVRLPEASWVNLLQAPTPNEVPPFPPLGSNSNSTPDTSTLMKVHHYIRDTMFLDAVVNIENDNP